MFVRDDRNVHGTPISVFTCCVCNGEFTICPAPAVEKRRLYERQGCGDAECDSYDPRHDAMVLFGDFSMFNRYCERKGIDPAALSSSLRFGKLYRENASIEGGE